MQVTLPEKTEITEPYSRFLWEGECNTFAEFFYIPEIAVKGGLIRKEDFYDAYEDEESFYFFYHTLGGSDYYALRLYKKGEMERQTIYLPEKYRGEIHSRLIFSLIGFEDIAVSLNSAVIHASYIDTGGGAVLFTAPCGTGKSTQAALWETHKNSEIINGDKALIYEKDGEHYAGGLPFSGSSDICKNKSLPVKAVVRLYQGRENKALRLTGAQAYAVVYEGCCRSLWSKSLNQKIASIAAEIAETVPVVRFDCLPDASAVKELEEFLKTL
ncbi:MAG: hypothetical protein LUG85_03560 [Clostridiales bacterium]|nr:hypothetical protein [Clostridiales bacterium]